MSRPCDTLPAKHPKWWQLTCSQYFRISPPLTHFFLRYTDKGPQYRLLILFPLRLCYWGITVSKSWSWETQAIGAMNTTQCILMKLFSAFPAGLWNLIICLLVAQLPLLCFSPRHCLDTTNSVCLARPLLLGPCSVKYKLTLGKMAVHSVMSGPVKMTAELKLHF